MASSGVKIESTNQPMSTRDKCISILTKCLHCKNVLIWSFGLAVMIGLTIKDFHPLLFDYCNNNVATQVQVVIVDTDFKPPRLLIGLPFNKWANRADDDLMIITRHLINDSIAQCKMCQDLKEKSWNVWEDMNMTGYAKFGEDSLYAALSLEIAKRYFSTFEFEKEDVLDERFSAWNEPIFSAVLNMIVWQCHADFDMKSFMPIQGLNLWVQNDPFKNSSKYDLFAERVLMALCRKMNISEQVSPYEFDHADISTNTTCLDLFLDKSSPVYLGIDGAWLPLPRLGKPEIHQYLFSFPHQDRNALWHTREGNPMQSLILYPDISPQYMSALDTLYSTALFEAPNSGQPGGHIITVRYSVHMRAKDERPGRKNCHNEDSVTLCFTKCTKSWILESCDCVPFAFKRGLEYNQSLSQCTMMDYATCNLTILPKKERDGCLDKCKAACEYIAYSWQISHQSGQSSVPNSSEFNIRIIPSFGTFAEFTWVAKSSPEEFLSQTGGLLNFYLGVSGMSFFAIVMAGVERLRRWMGRKKRNKDVVTEMWQWTRATDIRPPSRGPMENREWLVEFIRSEMDGRLEDRMKELKT